MLRVVTKFFSVHFCQDSACLLPPYQVALVLNFDFLIVLDGSLNKRIQAFYLSVFSVTIWDSLYALMFSNFVLIDSWLLQRLRWEATNLALG